MGGRKKPKSGKARGEERVPTPLCCWKGARHQQKRGKIIKKDQLVAFLFRDACVCFNYIPCKRLLTQISVLRGGGVAGPGSAFYPRQPCLGLYPQAHPLGRGGDTQPHGVLARQTDAQLSPAPAREAPAINREEIKKKKIFARLRLRPRSKIISSEAIWSL